MAKAVEPKGNGPPDGQLLTVEDVAALLRISSNAVRKLEDNGRLPRGMRLSGGMVRWPRKVIEQWVEEGCPSHPKA